MNISSKLGLMIMALLTLTLPLLAACNSDDDTGAPTAIPTSKLAMEDDVENMIDLADIPDGRIYQRDSSNQYDLVIEGTYSGNPTSIEARIIMEGSSEEVLPWTMMDDNPKGEAFSDVLEDIPQGGWYNIQVRFSNDSSCMDEGLNKFGVGVLVVCAGQSHMDLWFERYELEPYVEEWLSYNEPTADELTRMYRHEQVLQQGPAWDGWQPVTGVGAVVFANKLREALGVPVGLLDYAVGGSALWQGNTIDVASLGIEDLVAAMGWWLPDDSGITPEDNDYAALKAGLETVGNNVEAALWVQGHTDAASGESLDDYKSGLEQLFAMMRLDTGISDLPIFISLVTRQGSWQGWTPITSDENIHNVRTAEELYIAEDENTYLGCTSIDLPICGDNVHHSPLGQEIQAKRLAQAVLHVILNSGDYTYHRGPQLTSYEIVDSSTIDVHITHSGGTDLTPTSGIQGFEVILGDSVIVPETAGRHDADTIRLMIGDNTDAVTGIRYLYGGNPDNLDLLAYTDEYVHDNSSLQLPLEGGPL